MSRELSGSTQYLQIETPVVTSYPFTVAGWFRTDTLASYQGIFWLGDKDVTYTYLCVFFHVTQGTLAIVNKDNSTHTEHYPTNTVSADTWHHFCAVAFDADGDSDDLRIILDGDIANEGSGASTGGGALVDADRTAIGAFRDSTPGDYFNGEIDRVAIWDGVVLSDEEIVALANGMPPNAVRPGSIACNWPLYGLHSPEIDIGGGGNSLTVTGATRGTSGAPVRLRTPFFFGGFPAQVISAGGGGTDFTGTATVGALPISGGTGTLAVGVSFSGTATAGAVPINGGTGTLTVGTPFTGTAAVGALPISGGTGSLTIGVAFTGTATTGALPINGGTGTLDTGGSFSGTATAGALPLAGQTGTLTLTDGYIATAAAGGLPINGGTGVLNVTSAVDITLLGVAGALPISGWLPISEIFSDLPGIDMTVPLPGGDVPTSLANSLVPAGVPDGLVPRGRTD